MAACRRSRARDRSCAGKRVDICVYMYVARTIVGRDGGSRSRTLSRSCRTGRRTAGRASNRDSLDPVRPACLAAAIGAEPSLRRSCSAAAGQLACEHPLHAGPCISAQSPDRGCLLARECGGVGGGVACCVSMDLAALAAADSLRRHEHTKRAPLAISSADIQYLRSPPRFGQVLPHPGRPPHPPPPAARPEHERNNAGRDGRERARAGISPDLCTLESSAGRDRPANCAAGPPQICMCDI